MGEGSISGFVLLAHFIVLVVNIAMVVIGVEYSDPYSCIFPIVSQFLKISGGIMIGFAALNLFCTMCYKYRTTYEDGVLQVIDDEEEGGNSFAIGALVGIAQMITIVGLFIWACVPIFSQYSNWKYDLREKRADDYIYGNHDYAKLNYCAYTPFMFAFVMLILYGIATVVIAICFLCFCCFCWASVCCDSEDNPSTEGQSTTTGAAGTFRRSVSNTSQTANAYNRNLQTQLQRLSSFRPNVGGHSSGTSNTDNPESVPTTNNSSYTAPQTLPSCPQNYNPSVVIRMPPVASAPPLPDLPIPEDLPPSYDEAIKQQ